MGTVGEPCQRTYRGRPYRGPLPTRVNFEVTVRNSKCRALAQWYNCASTKYLIRVAGSSPGAGGGDWRA
eukprot:6938665-Pyramimonas_sp.AAC.1